MPSPKVGSGGGEGSPVTTFLWILAIVLVLVILIALFGGCIRCRPSDPSVAPERLTMSSGNTATISAETKRSDDIPVSFVSAKPVAPAAKPAVNVSVSGTAPFRAASGPSDVEPVDFSGGPGLLDTAAAF